MIYTVQWKERWNCPVEPFQEHWDYWGYPDLGAIHSSPSCHSLRRVSIPFQWDLKRSVLWWNSRESIQRCHYSRSDRCTRITPLMFLLSMFYVILPHSVDMHNRYVHGMWHLTSWSAFSFCLIILSHRNVQLQSIGIVHECNKSGYIWELFSGYYKILSD